MNAAVGGGGRRRGVFVTFEGPEGAGKSTQIRELAARLKSQDVPLVTTREPGGTPVADRVREILTGSGPGAVDARTELLLLLAGRSHHVETVIRPALEAGQMVICDRFSDSTVCYQGAGRGLDRETIGLLNEYATGGLAPDLTFLIDLDPKIGLHRLKTSERKLDRFEQEKAEFHQRVREAYLELASNNKERFVLVRGDRKLEEIRDEIYQALWNAFPTFVRES